MFISLIRTNGLRPAASLIKVYGFIWSALTKNSRGSTVSYTLMYTKLKHIAHIVPSYQPHLYQQSEEKFTRTFSNHAVYSKHVLQGQFVSGSKRVCYSVCAIGQVSLPHVLTVLQPCGLPMHHDDHTIHSSVTTSFRATSARASPFNHVKHVISTVYIMRVCLQIFYS